MHVSVSTGAGFIIWFECQHWLEVMHINHSFVGCWHAWTNGNFIQVHQLLQTCCYLSNCSNWNNLAVKVSCSYSCKRESDIFGNNHMLTYPWNKRILLLLSWPIPIPRTSKTVCFCFFTSTCISYSGYPSGRASVRDNQSIWCNETLFAKQISPQTAGSRGCTVGQTWPFPICLSFPETLHAVFVPKHSQSESHSMSAGQVSDTKTW